MSDPTLGDSTWGLKDKGSVLSRPNFTGSSFFGSNFTPPHGSFKARARKILKVAAYVVAVIAVVVTILLIAFRIALARVPDYRAQVQAWVSERTHLAIEFKHMDARLRFYGPELVFDDAVVRSQDRSRVLVTARQVSLAFDFWTAVGTGRLAAGRLTLDAPELQVVRTMDGRFEVVGQRELPESESRGTFRPDDLPTGRLHVTNARVGFRDYKRNLGPWIVPGVNFDLQRTGRSLHIEGETALPQTLGSSIKFNADASGKLSEPRTLEWQFMVEAKSIDLAGWTQIMPHDWPAPRRGRGSFQASGSMRGIHPNDVELRLGFDQVVLALPAWEIPLPAPPTMEYRDEDTPEVIQPAASYENKKNAYDANVSLAEFTRVAFDLRLHRVASETSETFRINVNNLELSRAQQPWQSKAIVVNATRTAASGIEVNANADVVVLDNLWPLLAYAPQSQQLARLRGVYAQGTLRDIELRAARSGDSSPVVFTTRGRFANVGTRPVEKIPGVTHFSGTFAASENGGQVDLNVHDGALEIPRIFRTPLPANTIVGRMSWQHEGDGWHIVADGLRIETPDGKATAHGAIFVPGDGSSPTVEVEAQGSDLDARAAPRYLPAGRTPPTVLAWLDRAFTAGRVPHAEFQMHGPTRAFPFRNGEGLFLIQAHIEGLGLDYQPGWLPASDLSIDAEFRNAGMTAEVRHGTLNGLQIASASGKIADFKHGELVLDGQAHGDIDQALTFLQKSPIGPAVGAQFMALHGHGVADTRVHLLLPFANIDQRKVTVTTRVDNCTVALDGISESASGVSGEIVVQDQTVKSLTLQGVFLGGRVNVKGGAENRYYGPGAGIQVSANGQARSDQLVSLLHLPSSVTLGGTMQWQLKARQARHAENETAPRTLTIESDTKGLSIGLPAPVGKSPDVARTLRFDIDGSDDDQIMLRGAFGDARALVRIGKKDDGWTFDRADLRVDGQAAALPAHEGLRIEGAIQRLDLDDWLKLKGSGDGKGKLSDYLRAATVRVGNFSFLGYSWSDVRTILQAGDDSWRVDLAGDDVAGQLTIPFSLGEDAPLRVALSKLNVGDHSKEDTHGIGGDADPRDLPAISGRVDELSLSGRRVGAARFALEKNSQGVKLTSGELRGASFTTTAQGSWLWANNGSTSTLTLDVASTDVRDTLRAFNFHDVISGKRANAHAALTWPGGIDENLLSRASGTVHIEVNDGQLLDVEPGGPARMLGLMSIAALPRRLALDFGDVTEKGFSFDVAKADFQLKSGDAFTNNLLIRGPGAEVGIVGRTGLAKHDYDLTAAAAGDIGGSLSVASTVVGGPVLGAAVLAFTRLFKEPLKGVTRRYYRIDGPWDNPHIERIDKVEAKQEAADAAKEEK